jgi:hypothetical protein
MTFTSLLKHPSALVPLVMSFAAFLLIIAVLSTVGITHQQDEGAPAHIFQLLIALQVPIIAFFALKWLPRNPRPTLLILLLQIGAALLAVATIAWLESGMAV